MRAFFNRRLFRPALLALMILVGTAGIYIYSHQEKDALRLHVLANSDSAYDQKVKLIIRDKALAILAKDLTEAENKKEAMTLAAKNLSLVEKECRQTLKNYAAYDLAVSLERADFPLRTYGNITLPAGEYDALRVVLGEGKGKNWWCVLFPALCFVNGASVSEQTVSAFSGDSPPEEKIEIRFKAGEFLEKRR